MSLPHIQLMTRKNCSLCDDARDVIVQLAEQERCTWESVDVDRDKTLMVRFGLDVPVLLLNDEVVAKHRVSREELTGLLNRHSVSEGLVA